MRENGYEVNDLYHLNVIDVSFLRENIVAVTVSELSKARSSQRRQREHEGCVCK